MSDKYSIRFDVSFHENEDPDDRNAIDGGTNEENGATDQDQTPSRETSKLGCLYARRDDDEDTLLLDYPGIIMYAILYFWAAVISIMISPAIITIYTLFKALSVNYIVRKKDKTDEPPQKMNLISFIKNVFYSI